jgi:hypothetical protein
MAFFKKIRPQSIKKQLSKIAVVTSLFMSFSAPFSAYPAMAAEIPSTVTSIRKAPYSRVFYTGSIYAVNDSTYFGLSPFVGDFFWSEPYSYSYFPDDFFPVYEPPLIAETGLSEFDISQLAGTIAQLPNQTLQMRLYFSDGETQTWHLGKGTVEALKQLVAINQ